MLLFSLLWLNATGYPKPSAKPSISACQSAVAVAPLSSHPSKNRLPPGSTSVSFGKKAPQPKPSSNQAPPAEKKQQSTLPLETSEPSWSCCCGSSSFSSSNTPDNAAVVIPSFVKPGDYVQDTFLNLSREFPDMFRILEENNLLRRELDEIYYFYMINNEWAKLEAEFTTTLNKSISNSKWFTIAGVVGSLLAMGGSLYLSFGTDLLTGIILGLGSTAISVLTSALDYIKAGTVDHAKRAMEKVTSACSFVRNMIPSRFQDIIFSITEEEDAKEDAKKDLERIMTLIQQIKPNEETSCCTSVCCNCECDSALGELYDCFFCEKKVDYTRIERSPQALEAARQKLEEKEKWWQSGLAKIRIASLASGVVAPILNTLSGALFLTTSLTRQASLETFNITSTLRDSLDSLDDAFQGTKFANLGISITDFLMKMVLFAIQSKIDRIKKQRDDFDAFVEKLIKESDGATESVSQQFLQDLAQLSARSARTGKV